MSLKFDFLADHFDTQRGLPLHALQAWTSLIEELAAGSPLHIIEPGIGTGRVALPLAVMVHTVVGADISASMLTQCAASAQLLGISNQLNTLKADARDLPLSDQSFDLGVIAQLLYLVSDWPTVLDELARLVKSGGYVIHLAEPTTEDDLLRRWSSTWRQMIEATGYMHAPISPTGADVHAEFLRRWPDVHVRKLASWSFGQSVAEAMADYADRLRPLYEALTDDEWQAVTTRFLNWAQREFADTEQRLDGIVTLTAMIAAV